MGRIRERLSERHIMATKITRDVLESYLRCKTKAQLKLTGQEGTKSDYECMMRRIRDEVRLTACRHARPASASPRRCTIRRAGIR
jgi:hypothetical protein